jgi:SAM-dependent methyltransferase
MAIEAQLIWQSECASGLASHCDRLLLADNAFLADGRWARAAEQARNQGEAELDLAPWVQPTGQEPVDLPAGQFRLPTAPITGRFYPRMAFTGLAQSPRDMRATRLLDATDDVLRVDPNHPLAGFDAKLVFRLEEREPTRGVRMVELFEGPGMQAPAQTPALTYFKPGGFTRQDDASDPVFYAQPRLIHHLDATCRAAISALYGRFLQPGQRVLDLMSSWQSHLPDMPGDLQVAGLGMNAAELAANPRLSEAIVHDLNETAELPWRDAVFDVVVCTASIEYLLNPAAVMAQVRRVLKPGGVFVVTFSDRWFPTKAIKIWSELHPFERLGLVLALFQEAGFSDLHSETRRGLKRPEDDKYADQRLYSDPLFAAWGTAPVS